MILDPSRVLVSLAAPEDRWEVARLAFSCDLVLEELEEREEREERDPEVINHTPRRFWLRTRENRPASDLQLEQLAHALGDRLEWTGPVYRLSGSTGRGGLLCPLPNVLLLKTAPDLDPAGAARARETIKQHGLREDTRRSKCLGGYHYFLLADLHGADAYALQRELLGERGDLFVEARFENMPMVKPLALVPNEPPFASDWGEAPSRPRIPPRGAVICVLDEGSHGAACAEIAAGSCTILPIALESWSDVECALGINFAAESGASVISMSFGMYAPGEGFGPMGWDFSLIDPAIQSAVEEYGCVLCAAAGNEDTGLVNRYPARHPSVIAVGGADPFDYRTTANFGPGISVVASPGFRFDGTSASTPQVASLAGLLMSRHPALLPRDVRAIIEQTADKVGGVYFEQSGYPNGHRHTRLGYGRINVKRALSYAARFSKYVRRAPLSFAFVAGNAMNSDRTMEIVVDRSRFPKEETLLLALDADGTLLPRAPLPRSSADPTLRSEEGLVFLERTMILASLGSCRGLFSPGPRRDCLTQAGKLGDVSVCGGELILRDDKRYIQLRDETVVVRIEKQPHATYLMALLTSDKEHPGGTQHPVRIAQRNTRGIVVGAATAVFAPR